MMRGRKPKPARLKQLAGNPGGRKLNTSEPQASGLPVCPDDCLDDIGQREWRRVVPLLAEMGILGAVDQGVLAGYCSSYSSWVRAQRAIAKLGWHQVMKRDGAMVPLPLVRMAAQAVDQMRKLASELGMTPSSRSRLTGSSGAAKEDNPFAELAAEASSLQ